MKPQTFTNKLKAKGFRRNATGIWSHPNYNIGFKPIANHVTIWQKRQGFDGAIMMTEVSPHKLETMDSAAILVKEITETPKVDNRKIFSHPEFIDANVRKDVNLSNINELYKDAPPPTTTIPIDTEKEKEDIQGTTGSNWSGGVSSGLPVIEEEEKTFWQKYKWFIIGGAILLFLIFKEQ